MPQDDSPLISVVIPVLDDAEALSRLLSSWANHATTELIVVNGGRYSDPLMRLVRTHREVRWLATPPGRGAQMNAGARVARGRWLLFLHADTALGDGWRAELHAIDRNPTIVGGSFTFRLDDGHWMARIIERGVAARVRWLRMPYGDQALFVRRDRFVELGGYREWPLMEDVDFVRRLGATGQLHHSAIAAVTSARRWRNDGWVKRSLGNIVLVTLFFAGVSPSRLARRYYRSPAARSLKPATDHRPTGIARQPPRVAVAVMARAPSDGQGKTRLLGGIRDFGSDHYTLKRALLLDTLDACGRTRGAEVVVLFTPETSRTEFEHLAPATRLLPQRGLSLGDRLSFAFSDLSACGYTASVIVGSDVPTVPAAFIEQACEALASDRELVALGPAEDGGYYLVGLRAARPEIFAGIPWSTAGVLSATVAAAARAGVPVWLAPAWRDVDDVSDLRLAVAEAEASVGVRTRQWITEHAKNLEPV